MGRGETRGSVSESMRRKKKQRERRKNERAYREREKASKKIFYFPWLQRLKNNIIFIGNVMHERERLFSNFFFLENNLYKISLIFIRVFLLTKDCFPLTFFFLCYQTLENNYLYRRFSSETNRALVWS